MGVRLVRCSIVVDGGELVELGIGKCLRLGLVGRFDLCARLVSRSIGLDGAQLRALNGRNDSTATGTCHIAVRGHQTVSTHLGGVGRHGSVVGHLGIEVADRGSRLSTSVVGAAHEVGVRLVRCSIVVDASKLGPLSRRDDGTATGTRNVTEGSHAARGVDSVGHCSSVSTGVTREVGGHVVEGHVVGRAHGLADGHSAVGDRHPRASGEVGARLGSAWTSVGHDTRGVVVAEASVTTGIGGADGGAAAGIRVVEVGPLGQITRVVVADVAYRTGHSTRDTTAEGCGASEGGGSSNGEAVAYAHVVSCDDIVTHNHVTRRFDLCS